MIKTIPTARRAAAALVALAALVAAGYYSTSAYFSDTVNGTFSVSTATPDLVIEYGGNSYDTVPALNVSNMIPGDSEGISGAALCNEGTVPLYLQANVKVHGNQALANALEVTGSLLSPVNLGPGTATLQQIEDGTPVDSGSWALPDGECLSFEIGVSLDDDGDQSNMAGKAVAGSYTIEGRTSQF